MIAFLRRTSGILLLPPLKYLPIIPLLIALPALPANKNQEASEMDTYKVYIVEFKEKPLATYRGNLADYPATSPSHTGKKLDFKRSNVVQYRKYLDQQKSVYLSSIKQKLKRSPDVLQNYNVSFFGISIQLKSEEAIAIMEIPGIKRIRPDEMRTLLSGP